MNENKREINTVCFECGEKYGRHKAGICTAYEATCDICHKYTECTEIRDFGYLKTDTKQHFEI
jgi:hypothetical protein